MQGGECKVEPRNWAHCHVRDGKCPRGTICISRHVTKVGVKEWHQLIAHEVTHLAVKSSHKSVTFARRMVTLGQADYREARLVRAQKRHRHDWDPKWFRPNPDGTGPIRTCCICGKSQNGIIKWRGEA